MDEAAADIVVEVLSTGGPTIENFVQENIVTFATFFKMLPQLQENIIEALSNRDLSALLAGLIDEKAERVKGMVSANRMELIQEEVERLQGKGQRAIDQAHDVSKRQVVKRISALRVTGTIADLLDPNRVQSGSKPSGDMVESSGTPGNDNAA